MNKNNRFAKICSILGMFCLQISAVPAIIQALYTGETAPLSNMLLIAAGLMFCSVTEWHYKLWAYLIGSLIGLSGQIVLIALVLAR